jgi:hypothetical protein
VACRVASNSTIRLAWSVESGCKVSARPTVECRPVGYRDPGELRGELAVETHFGAPEPTKFTHQPDYDGRRAEHHYLQRNSAAASQHRATSSQEMTGTLR